MLKILTDHKVRYDINGKSSQLNWNIKMAERLNPASITPQTVFLHNSDAKRVPAQVSYNGKSGYITVAPKIPYVPGEVYTLVLSENVKKSSNASIGEMVEIKFQVPTGNATADAKNASKAVGTVSTREDTENKGKSAKAVLAGTGFLLLATIIFFALFGGVGSVKAVNTPLGKFYYTSDCPGYDELDQDRYFASAFAARINGYTDAWDFLMALTGAADKNEVERLLKEMETSIYNGIE